MATLIEWGQRAAVSVRALTHTTEQSAHSRGVAPFLPRLFVDRFTHLGGIPDAVFRAQLAQCRSFEDGLWAPYWSNFAAEHLERADTALSRLGAPVSRRLLGTRDDAMLSELGTALAPAAGILADRGTVADPRATERFVDEHPEASDAAVAIDGLIKALVYYFVAAWPGGTPRRLAAYLRSARLAEALLLALAPTMGDIVDVVDIDIPGTTDRVHGILALPSGPKQVPTVLVTNGLEGTIAETLLPLLAQRDAGLGTFVMEMPGTYSYDNPMTAASEAVYSAVIDFLAADGRVDAERIGMMGFSFGAYWSARMAASDSRVKVAVSNGPLTHRSFGALNSIGMPEVMVSTLVRTLGATGTADLMRKISTLSLRDRYRDIDIPLLVINGAEDTLASTRDSIELAIGAPHAQLVLYAQDDHCAMGNAEHWSALSTRFLREHLLGSPTPTELLP
ncbi:alpha/beta hydrolase [Rhodococcus sp. 1R11]|uniref:alpha/beta hydrolase family protein n=1 Tax=Rhodococcus sp. 1R11 TaxID=2559614 RepID=UPI001072C4D6|nr:alpha/beta hydrolase [Rhodococcus sp. 1R11]TFI42550.1 alpha/beta hydrolase [Rhodococcus sp. 1R11]